MGLGASLQGLTFCIGILIICRASNCRRLHGMLLTIWKELFPECYYISECVSVCVCWWHDKSLLIILGNKHIYFECMQFFPRKTVLMGPLILSNLLWISLETHSDVLSSGTITVSGRREAFRSRYVFQQFKFEYIALPQLIYTNRAKERFRALA